MNDLVKEKTKQRVVVLHNNLDLSHFIKNETPCNLLHEMSKIIQKYCFGEFPHHISSSVRQVVSISYL